MGKKILRFRGETIHKRKLGALAETCYQPGLECILTRGIIIGNIFYV